jgi:hypothetical protein
VPNVLAIVALLVATTGTATAARVTMISGKDVKDSTLTGADFRNLSLQAVDFSSRARTSMRGASGAVGAAGPQGDKGVTGPQGATGAQGDAARVASKFAWFDSRYLATSGSNAAADNWFDYNGATPNGNITLPNNQFVNTLNRPFEPVLDLNYPNCNVGDVQGVDCAWGSNAGGGVTVSWDSNITAVASITVMHSQDSDILAGGTVPHTRVSCYLAANRGSGSSDFDQIGARADVSGFRQRQVETLTVVGSINRTASTSTDYMVRVECRDADGTNSRTRWNVISGSMSVIATERG